MESGTLTIWVAVIAVVMTLQFIAIVVVGMMAWRFAQRSSMVVDGLLHEVVPVVRKASLAIDDMQQLAVRARQIDQSAQDKIKDVQRAWDTTKRRVFLNVWPVIGVAKAVQAAASRWRERRNGFDRNAEARFTYEGGSHARE